MLWFIIAVSLVFGLIMGLRASYEEVRVDSDVFTARAAGVIIGALAGAVALVSLLVLWGAGALWWNLIG